MQEVVPRSPWRRVVREPLVHFVAIGLVLFAVDAWRSGGRETASPAPVQVVSEAPRGRAPIVVDAGAVERIRARAERTLGRTPTADEVAAETERWIDGEVLYREALERELQRDDPMIHERLAERMSYILEQAAIVPEPGEPELRAWFEEHRERWSVPERVDFTHVFIAPRGNGDDEQRARQFEAALSGGTAPERIGDRFAGGHRYRGRRIADLAQAFGDEFATGLEAQEIGVWHRRRSRFGVHVVRVDRVQAARSAEFDAARLDVRREWRDARRDAEVAAALQRVRTGWQVVRP